MCLCLLNRCGSVKALVLKVLSGLNYQSFVLEDATSPKPFSSTLLALQNLSKFSYNTRSFVSNVNFILFYI